MLAKEATNGNNAIDPIKMGEQSHLNALAIGAARCSPPEIEIEIVTSV